MLKLKRKTMGIIFFGLLVFLATDSKACSYYGDQNCDTWSSLYNTGGYNLYQLGSNLYNLGNYSNYYGSSPSSSYGSYNPYSSYGSYGSNPYSSSYSSYGSNPYSSSYSSNYPSSYSSSSYPSSSYDSGYSSYPGYSLGYSYDYEYSAYYPYSDNSYSSPSYSPSYSSYPSYWNYSPIINNYYFLTQPTQPTTPVYTPPTIPYGGCGYFVPCPTGPTVRYEPSIQTVPTDPNRQRIPRGVISPVRLRATH